MRDVLAEHDHRGSGNVPAHASQPGQSRRILQVPGQQHDLRHRAPSNHVRLVDGAYRNNMDVALGFEEAAQPRTGIL
ncbi:hypothetical protein ABT112_32890 [Streptomyces sp. NPDC002055]|uniref:hypothetical protein n=1 Tax=Streptomyces sp. NPDC002055 TaxID=3154534 RepID=UPI00332F7200